jgi:hypothetical protein
MEGWRQRRLGSREPSGKRRNEEERRKKERKNERTGLTLTGLLMEGVEFLCAFDVSLCTDSSVIREPPIREL